MKNYFLKLGNWLVRKYGPPPEPTPTPVIQYIVSPPEKIIERVVEHVNVPGETIYIDREVEKIVYKEPEKQYLPPIDPKIVAATKGLVNMVMSWDSSGEYKHHFVYAKLIKEFPNADKKYLNLAIELVLLKLVD